MKIYSILGLIMLCLGFGWYQSHLSTELAEKNATNSRIQAESVAKQLADAKTESDRVKVLLTNYQNTKQEKVYVDRVVTKEIIRYRDLVPDRCALDRMWVNTYNLSTMYSTESSPGVDDSPGGPPTDSAIVLEVATSNNRICVDTAQRLLALQQYVFGL